MALYPTTADLQIDGALITAMYENNLVGCPCFTKEEATSAKFTWNGDEGVDFDSKFDPNKNYSIAMLLDKLQASDKLRQAFKAKFGSGQVGYKTVVNALVEISRREMNVPNESAIGALKAAGIFSKETARKAS
jgi:hypothetical protein